jgi:hypothetical protein
MVGGFTRYIPASPHSVNHKGKQLKAGAWPVEEGSMPIHLFQKGCTIVWGGHVVNSKGVKGTELSGNNHQPTHSDYGSTGIGGAEQWEILNGLSHPCTYNTPIEDYREIEWYNVEEGNVFDAEKNGTNVKIGMGQILVMHADTHHRGKSHIWEEGKWHPSLHCAVESRRYPRIDGGDAIDLVAAPETVMRVKDISQMSSEQVGETLQNLVFGEDRLKGLVKTILFDNREDVDEKTTALANVLNDKVYGKDMDKYLCEQEDDAEEGKPKRAKRGGTDE